jgi:hypothetical protein
VKKKIAIWVSCSVLFFALIFFLFELRYPNSYYKVKKGMTEEEVDTLLLQDGFIRVGGGGAFNDVWLRKQILGEWTIACSYDKGKIWHTATSLHVPFGGEYVRARNKNFQMGDE